MLVVFIVSPMSLQIDFYLPSAWQISREFDELVRLETSSKKSFLLVGTVFRVAGTDFRTDVSTLVQFSACNSFKLVGSIAASFGQTQISSRNQRVRTTSENFLRPQ